jgi:hypothetical protein
LLPWPAELELLELVLLVVELVGVKEPAADVDVLQPVVINECVDAETGEDEPPWPPPALELLVVPGAVDVIELLVVVGEDLVVNTGGAHNGKPLYPNENCKP